MSQWKVVFCLESFTPAMYMVPGQDLDVFQECLFLTRFFATQQGLGCYTSKASCEPILHQIHHELRSYLRSRGQEVCVLGSTATLFRQRRTQESSQR